MSDQAALSLSDFLKSIRRDLQQFSFSVDIRSIIQAEEVKKLKKAPKTQAEELRVRPNALVKMIWESIGYRFVYLQLYLLSCALEGLFLIILITSYHSTFAPARDNKIQRIKYHCSQSKSRQKQPSKVTNESKHRDRGQMTTFDCKGWIMIDIRADLNSGAPGADIVKVRLTHDLEHAIYVPIEIPQDVQTYISNNLNTPVCQVCL